MAGMVGTSVLSLILAELIVMSYWYPVHMFAQVL